MNVVYLKTGQEANLIKKIDDNNFIVEPLLLFEQAEADDIYEEYGERIVVDKIFRKAPVKKIEKEYLEILDKLDIQRKELRKAESETIEAKRMRRKVEEQNSDLSNLIFNRSELKNAKRITCFSNSTVPYDLDEKNKKYLKIQISVQVTDGEEKAWVYKWYGESWSNSNYIDPEYGFIIDATDEEILEIAKNRVAAKPKDWLDDWDLKRAPDTYLTDQLLNRRKKLLDVERKDKIKDTKLEIVDKQEKLRKLLND